MSVSKTTLSSTKPYFEVTLPRTVKMKVYRREGAQTNEYARKLQDLYDKGLSTEFDALKKKYEEQGHKFITPRGQVSEVFESGKTAQVPIKFQVKGGSITWYLDYDMDMTTQKERDELYHSAAMGHLKVADHCEKYWRGTNSLHVKKMHTKEAEAGLNHNHYRVQDDKDVGPSAVAEHLTGMVEAQQEMGLMVGGQEKFLTIEEAAEISKQFNEFWIVANHAGPAWTYKLHDKTISLPPQEESLISAYKKSPTQKFTKEDEAEWAKFKGKENPCHSITASSSTADKLKAIQEGMRGLGAELANTRQMDGSAFKEVSTVVAKDDILK